MTIQTKPVFYYVDPITKDNNSLSFREPNQPPALELITELNVGTRAPEELVTETVRALNDIGQETYSVTFDRNTRLVTISSTDIFDLLISSGSTSGNSVFSLLGFTGSDLTGASSYTANNELGVQYLPQFFPQQFVSFDDNLEGIQTSINESAAGVVEVVTFGNRRLMEMEITNITNRPKVKGHPIDNNQNAVEEARAFLTFIISKSNLEFMIDRENRLVFDTIILERTRQSRTGTSFRLSELVEQGLESYFTTGRLTFRRV